MFGTIIEREENLLARLSDLLVRRKLETEGFATRLRDASGGAAAAGHGSHADREREYKARVLKKIRSFFEL